MTDNYERYRRLEYRLPGTYLSWDLFGAGLENLGRGGKAVELPLRDPTPDEVLLRVDALGLCFSDTKLIWAGAEHPRIRGRDLAGDPTVPGHEAALTVARVGGNWKGKFSPGQRFIIQADIAIGGEQKAFGYVQRGAMAQYVYAGPWVLDGDGVCYLLPIMESTGYAEAALVEPWACVEAAYHIADRQAPLAGGRMLVVILDAGLVSGLSLRFDAPPGKIHVLGGGGDGLSSLGAPVELHGSALPRDIERVARAAGGFDDIILIGNPDMETVEACDAALAPSGVLCFLSESVIAGQARLDIGRAHYDRTRHVGADTLSIAAAYGANTRTELKGGGKTWMIGAAGPMGQMHVQRALELPEPPRKILCTDMSEERLGYMAARLGPLAAKKGVELRCLRVGGGVDVDAEAGKFADGGGFDDAYVHAPVAALVEDATRHLAAESILNVFAGVGIGTRAALSPEIFRWLHARLIGSSGSSMQDIVATLAKLESGNLATRMSLAALGGINAVWNGIQGLKENRFPGKTVIFPQVAMELTGVDRLGEASPEAASALEPGPVWTNAAERMFLDSHLKLD